MIREVYLNGPFYTAITVLIVINLILTVWILVVLSTSKSRERLASIDRGINGILFFCLCMIFFTFMDPIYDMFRVYHSIAAAGTGDLKVMIYGIIEFLLPMTLSLAISSFFLIVWFLLREYHRMKMK